MSPHTRRLPTILVLAILLSVNLAGTASGDTATKTVGAISVDASGQASGANVRAVVREAEGIVDSYTSEALGVEVFSRVKVNGFVQAEKIIGVGSSALILRGKNAVIAMHDNVASLLAVQAVDDVDVDYQLGSKVKAASRTGHSLPLTSPAGQPIGGLVILGADGRAGAGSFLTSGSDGRVTVHLEKGSTSIFRAHPSYVGDTAFNDAILGMLGSGALKAEFISENTAGATAISKLEYYGKIAATATVNDDGVFSSLLSRIEDAGVVAYDLAYESLAVEDLTALSVYVDGRLATRATSPSGVAAARDSGSPSYYALKAEGRTLVIVSTPDFKSAGEHRISLIKSHADATHSDAESQGRAEAKVAFEAAVSGFYTLNANGRALGKFSSARIDSARAEITDMVQLESRVQYINSIRIEGSTGQPDSWTLTDSSGKSLRLQGKHSSVMVSDDAFGTTIVKASGESVATIELGPGVAMASSQDGSLLLEGPNGYVGTLVVARQDARAPDPGVLVADAKTTLVITLKPGYELILRSLTEARRQTSEEVESAAVAGARIGAEVVAGTNVNGRTTSAVSYFNGVSVQAQVQASGAYEVSYRGVNDATSFIFDGRATALAIKSKADIEVTVDGQRAVAYDSLADVLAKTGYATYFVETSANGELRIVVNTVDAKTAHVTRISSKLETDARGAAKADAFGTFRQFYDGTSVGSYVRLRTLLESGVVSDYALMSTGTSVFTSVRMGASGFQSGGAEGVSTLVLENRETVTEIADTSTAWIKVVAKEDSGVTFNLAPQIIASQRSDAIVVLEGPDGFIGSMIVTDIEGRVASGSRLTADEASRYVHVDLAKGVQVIFKTHAGIETELSDQQRDMMNKAIAAGRVGGQVVVQTKASLAALKESARETAGSTSASGQTRAQSLVGVAAGAGASITTSMTAAYYSDVQLVTAATRDRIDITVSSAVHAGKTIIVSLDPETIPGLFQGQAEILVDGEAAAQADSYADVLNPSDDGGLNEYFVLAGEAGAQVLVSIAHFSTRTVTLKSQDAAGSPVFMYATMFLGVLVAAQSVVLWRKKR